jgi:FMN phosphatase YigB (HAD superfamily)
VKPPRVLLFDVFGTLVDWRSSLIEIAGTTAGRSGV